MNTLCCKVQIFQPLVRKCLADAVFIPFLFCGCFLPVWKTVPPSTNGTKWHYKDFFYFLLWQSYFLIFLWAAVEDFFYNILYLLSASSFYKGVISINYIVIRPYFHCAISAFSLPWFPRYGGCSAEWPES